MLDSKGFISSWNPGAERFKGYTESEIVGQHFSRFYTEEDRRTGLPARALEISAREGKFEQEGWRVRKDGTRFWAHVVIDPIRDGSGSLVGYAKVTRDLTERKRAAESLRSSEEQFRLLVQSVSDYAIFMLDADGRVANWNLGAERIKGYRADEIVGEHFSRFYTDEDREAGVPQLALKTATEEGRFEKEGWRIRKDGTRFWASVVIDAIRNDEGKVIGFAKVTRDISEKRKSQHTLEEAREAMFQLQKMESLGQLTGGIAHDFNNLLMAILSSLSLLRKRLPHEPKISALLNNAYQGAERGVSLTRRMLAFARRQELKLESVSVPALVHGMTDLLQRSLGPQVTITTSFPLGLPAVLADAHQLESALLNLSLNARDAMPLGGSIDIEARVEESVTAGRKKLEAGHYVCVSVVDGGEGMDEATLARATEPFFTTKGVGKGTGLGLPMVSGLAEQLGGALILKSRKGEGTTAELWLPLADQKSDPISAGLQKGISLAGKKTRALVVLVVDDDGLILMNTAAMLEDLGHKALSAASGKQALEIVRRDEPIDLVITDQGMPHMTGAQLAEEIRARRPQLPIILATGYAELPANPRNLPVLSKPFLQDALEKSIATVTD
jgi:PAS domain S-box-containing protein